MIQSLLTYYVETHNSIDGLAVDNFTDFISKLLVTEPSDNAVIVSSIHQVKGLESKRVFIINYNLMPYTSQRKTADDNIQEKNLRYIAITRAKEILYLCEGEEDEDEKKYRGDQNIINSIIANAEQGYIEDLDDYDVELDY